MTVETMEGRTLFSVSVTEGTYGFYEITGTAGADAIVVTVDQDYETFTIGEDTYFGVAYLFIDAGGGDDVISVTSSTLGYIGASVLGGDGDDTITVNFDGAVWGGDGNDVIDLSDSFRGEVYGEDGDDEIAVHGGCYDAIVDGGDGNDLLDASDNDDGVFLYGGSGDDVIVGSAFNDHIWAGAGSDVIDGGAGNDCFYTVDGTGDVINGGDGTDTLYGDADEHNVVDVEVVI